VVSFAALQQLACLGRGTFALSGCSVRGLSSAFSSVSSTITSADSWTPAEGPTLERTLRPENFEIPELAEFGRKGVLRFRASRSSFRYDGESFHEEPSPAAEVARRLRPHMRGGMRLVYGFRDEQVVKGKDGWMVAKCSRFVDEAANTQKIVEAHAKGVAVAQYYAARFNSRARAIMRDKSLEIPTLFFVPCYAYAAEGAVPAGEPSFFAAERYLPGAFLKYNSNNGYVDEGLARHGDAAQAFVHFTFEASGGELLVADLQGVARESEILLTDPQVLSLQGLFGPGDLRARGLRACLAAHRCGPTCRSLGLSPLRGRLLRQLASEDSVRARVSSAPSDGWENVSVSSADKSWDQVEARCLEDLALSDGVRSSAVSGSSWVALDM